MFESTAGAARLRDLLPVLDGTAPMQPLRELLRVLEVDRGSMEFEICIDLRPNYARLEPRLERRGRLGWALHWRDEIIHVATDFELERQEDALVGKIRLDSGMRRYLSLAYSKGDTALIPPLGDCAHERLEQTCEWWQGWASHCSYQGRYREQVLRSAITLKLLTYSPSGAILAAATTSLPEALGRDRNFDYRYCWLRDAGLMNQALVNLGYDDEARGYLSWLLHATRLTWPSLNIVYDVFGRTNLVEHELPHLSGYRGSRPVRIGNGAYNQQQLDVYGEVIMAADAVASAGIDLDHVETRMLRGFGEFVCRHWREPDSSLWEIRGPARQYTFSKVMCWVALDRLLNLHRRTVLDLGTHAEIFAEARDRIAQAIEKRGYNDRIGSYTSELDGSHVDASLLLMPCVGYRPADDPRVMSTHRLITERLNDNGLLRRYEQGYDGIDSREGAFGICSFWSIDHLAKRGHVREAERQFERLLGLANDVGLYAEEIDPASGAALGNFPQAYTHVGLINAALAIEAARAGSGQS